MKRYLYFVIIIFILISDMLLSCKSFASPIISSESATNLQIDNKFNNAVVLLIGNNKAFVNGIYTVIDSSSQDVVPIIKNSKTLVPLRFISEKMGAAIEWNENTDTAIIKTESKTVEITLGNNKMHINGQECFLEVPAESINNRTFLPLRALVEALGKKVYYDRGLIIISDSENIVDCNIDKELIDRTIALFNNNPNADVALFATASGGKWGYMDSNGKIIIQPQFQDALEFVDGLAPVALNGKYGYINKEGKFVVEPKFDRAWKMSDGMGMVLLNKKCGFVDNSGKLVIEPKYDFLYTTFFTEGLACVGINKKCGFIDKNGKIVIEPKFSLASGFYEGLSTVLDETSSKWGFIDKTGNYVIKPVYTCAFHFTEGLAPVLESGILDGKWGYIDKNGIYVIKPQFKTAGNFKEDLAQARNNLGKVGYIDKNGNTVIDYKYDTVSDFSEGLAAVSIRDSLSNTSKYGFINKKGEQVVSMNYDYAFDFNNGLAMINIGYSAGYINKDGKYIWEPSEFSPFIN